MQESKTHDFGASWFPMYPGDYIRKTTCLSMLEHGAYSMLIVSYYANRSPLTNDMERLYRMTFCADEKDRKAVDSVIALFFHLGDDGLYHNKRADEELFKMIEKSEKARKSAGSRWGKQPMRTQCERICQRNANGMLTTSTSRIISKKENNNINTSSKKSKRGPLLNFGEFQTVRLTSEEHAKIVAQFGEDGAAFGIDTLDGYKASKGKRYANDYAVFKAGSWLCERIEAYRADPYRKKAIATPDENIPQMTPEQIAEQKKRDREEAEYLNKIEDEERKRY